MSEYYTKQRSVSLPEAAIETIAKLIEQADYPTLNSIVPAEWISSEGKVTIAMTEQQADAIVELLDMARRKVALYYPNYRPDDPNYQAQHGKQYESAVALCQHVREAIVSVFGSE